MFCFDNFIYKMVLVYKKITLLIPWYELDPLTGLNETMQRLFLGPLDTNANATCLRSYTKGKLTNTMRFLDSD